MVSKNMSKDYPKKNVSKKWGLDITPLRLKDDIPKDDIILMHTHSKDDIKKWSNTHPPILHISDQKMWPKPNTLYSLT